MSSLYDILGVDKTATRLEIKRAYRLKVAKSHPDVGGDVDEFKSIVKAWLVLSDDQSRVKYDRTGEEEKPSDRKPVDIEKHAKTLAITTIFQIIDAIGENSDKRNIKIAALKSLISVEADLKQRLINNKNIWKALKRKYKAVTIKLQSLKDLSYPQNFLIEVLENKLNHIDIQEILPTKEDHRVLLRELAILKRAKSIIEDSIDPQIDPEENDLMAQWDKAMGDNWSPF